MTLIACQEKRRQAVIIRLVDVADAALGNQARQLGPSPPIATWRRVAKGTSRGRTPALFFLRFFAIVSAAREMRGQNGASCTKSRQGLTKQPTRACPATLSVATPNFFYKLAEIGLGSL